VGKSTLMNCLLGEKISIICDKPQTTGTGSGSHGLTPAGVPDTPGIHKPLHKMNRSWCRPPSVPTARSM
jgi:GTP-binding protein Era